MSRPDLLSSSAFTPYPPPFHDPAAALASLSYRSFELPVRPSDLAPSTGASTPLHSRPPPDRMTYIPSEQELAELQELSNKYEPEISGPLVGERQSSNALTTEYANGDPVFRAKTTSLPQKYSHYRTCRGDGHCGWRAIAFSYFEIMARTGDRDKFLLEVTRLKSLRNLLNKIGFQEHLYEDFEEVMLDLLRDAATVAGPAASDELLLSTFNDEQLSLSIITYLKLLTSAWIQDHPDEYQPFLLGQDIRQYCAHSIEPSVCEIEHVGVSALMDVLVKPAGFAAEITYLDRTPGEEANLYRFDPLGPGGMPLPDPPTVRLLYRPGHYDILYRMEDVPQSMQPLTSPVYVAFAGQADDHDVVDIGMPDWMSVVPGMSTPTAHQFGWEYGSSEFRPSPALPAQRLLSAPAYAPLPTPAPPPQPHPAGDYPHSPLCVDPPMAQSLNPGPPHIERSEPFRPSVWQLEPEFATGPPHSLPFQTSIFRNSHYNTAHFLNPDFQPEEWTPDAEYVTSNDRPRTGRHKS